MDIIREKWDEILNTVKIEYQISDISFKTWLKPLQVHQVDDQNHIVSVLVPTQQMGIDYIKRKYMYALIVTITEFTGIEYEIEFLLPEQVKSKSSAAISARNTSINMSLERANLDPNYTFETFVVGDNNRLAQAAAMAVAESPGKLYNPLFIYGGAGLGKTHLMHSIAHFILDEDQDKKVLYVTSEAFTYELIASIRNSNSTAMSSFREKYRGVDVLLIDDIQFIIGREATQEEFFHTFNDLYSRKKQIIISSDKPPREIETLEARMKSRFEWGILVDISAPNYETRMAILHKKEELDGYNIDEKVLQYIASNVTSNIRELEGALNKLIALSRLEKGKEITLELAEEALKDIISPDQPREITADLIIETVAEHFHIQIDDIKSNRRNSEIAVPRQIAMYFCRYLLDISYKNIGVLMGGRDHSTVMHGVTKIEEELKSNETMVNTIDVIRKKINPV